MAAALQRVGASVERRKLEDALREAGDDEPRAAERLGLPLRVMMQKLKEHGLPVPASRG